MIKITVDMFADLNDIRIAIREQKARIDAAIEERDDARATVDACQRAIDTLGCEMEELFEQLEGAVRDWTEDLEAEAGIR